MKAKDAASGDVAKLSEAEKALSAAKETFLGSVVRIDAAAFDAVLAQRRRVRSATTIGMHG